MRTENPKSARLCKKALRTFVYVCLGMLQSRYAHRFRAEGRRTQSLNTRTWTHTLRWFCYCDSVPRGGKKRHGRLQGSVDSPPPLTPSRSCSQQSRVSPRTALFEGLTSSSFVGQNAFRLQVTQVLLLALNTTKILNPVDLNSRRKMINKEIKHKYYEKCAPVKAPGGLLYTYMCVLCVYPSVLLQTQTQTSDPLQGRV